MVNTCSRLPLASSDMFVSLWPTVDFTPISPGTQLVFTSAEPLHCVNVSIENDAVLEENEVFFVELSTNDPQVNLSSPSASVTILDNDGNLV